MKNKVLFSSMLYILIVSVLFAKENAEAEIKDGDIIFQTSTSMQSKPIQLATKSKYSHCGIVYKNGNNLFVYEAVGPVKLTPIKEWIARGKNNSYVVKRLKNAEKIITPTVLIKMKQVGNQFKGKPYDDTFEWSNRRMYCSELVWKIYQQAAGIEIGKLQKLKEFDLSDIRVKQIIKDRFHNKIPTEEIVISPAAIFDSELLVTVKSK